MSRAVVLVPVLVVLALVATGCQQSATPEPRAASPTPIARLNTSSMELPRVQFCDLIPAAAVRKALGSKATDSRTWKNGEEAYLGDTATAGRDVLHEFGCHFGDGAASADAWVFARPVSTGLGRAVLREMKQREGCTTATGPAFGTLSRRQTCQLSTGPRVRYVGLFGDTLLTCQAATDQPVATVVRRASAWCVDVANALNTAR